MPLTAPRSTEEHRHISSSRVLAVVGKEHDDVMWRGGIAGLRRKFDSEAATGSTHSMTSTSSFVGSEIADQRYLLHRIRRTLHTLGEFPERERGGSPRSRPCCNLNIVRFP